MIVRVIVLKGHDFSRAANATIKMSGFSPGRKVDSDCYPVNDKENFCNGQTSGSMALERLCPADCFQLRARLLRAGTGPGAAGRLDHRAAQRDDRLLPEGYYLP